MLISTFKAESLARMERLAKTEEDFREVTRQWDRREENGNRRFRYHRKKMRRLLGRLRKKLFRTLAEYRDSGGTLTKRQREFMDAYRKGRLEEQGDEPEDEQTV